MIPQAEPALTLLYDGACPLCLREVKGLQQRDQRGAIRFVDLNAPDYDPQRWGGISYRDGMARIHALRRKLEHAGCEPLIRTVRGVGFVVE